MSIIFEWNGKQYQYIPTKKEQIFRGDHQPSSKVGEKFAIKKILSQDDKFGQPYLENTQLAAEITGNKLGKKITIFKYKAKKRYKKKMGFRPQYTEFKIVGIETPKPVE
jgi:large subunit ribosomal protein L21